MGFLKLLFNAISPEGGREAMRASYKKHVHLAHQRGMSNAHQAGLYGALATRYRVRWQESSKPTETEIWIELIPFLIMDEEDSVEVLVEYVLYKEWPEEAKISWLKDRINKALSRIPEFAQDQKETIPHIARWYNLIEPDNKKRLFNELSA